MKHTIIKRIISLLVASTVMFCLAGNAFANTTAKKFSVDSIVSQYGGDQAEELRSLINKYIIVYGDSANQQRFLGLVTQKLAAGTPADHIMMMNILQVMEGFPEGSLPSGTEPSTRGNAGEIRANAGGIRPKIAVGDNHTVYLKHDGTVVTWGKYILDAESINDEDEEAAVNPTGQLMTIPITDVIDIAAGGGSALALKKDGTVWAWGVNTSGQLGDGTTTNRTTPVQVKYDSNTNVNEITAIAMGPYNGAAVRTDGCVAAWGDGSAGQLGNGTTASSTYAALVWEIDVALYLHKITAIAIGQRHMIALKADRTVVAWGNNGQGQLGNDSMVNSSYPVQVMDYWGVDYLSGITQISAGHNHSLALSADGTVYTWGSNMSGQIGIDRMLPFATLPELVVGPEDSGVLDNVTEISAGAKHSVAKLSNGKVYAWGECSFVDDTIETLHIPKEVNGGNNYGNGYNTDKKYIASKIHSGSNHLIAQMADGTVWGIGANEAYQLADTFPTETTTTWYKIYTPDAFIVDVSASSMNSIALASNGTLYASGLNSVGQLGIGVDGKSISPSLVINSTVTGVLDNIIAIHSGWYNTLAIKADGTVWAWGVNREGELGIGTTYDHSNKPVQVLGPNGTGFLQDVISVTTGDNYCVAVKSNGTVWAWGVNTHGQLGIGTTSNYSTTPVQVRGENGNGYLQDVISVTTDGTCCRALKSDGTLWEWGGQYGVSGQYPHETTSAYLTYGDVVKISGNMMLTSDGYVWTKGSNTYGQLGTGEGTNVIADNYDIVVGVNGTGYLTDIVDISGGVSTNAALAADGSVYTWGSNLYGSCGDNSTTDRNTPVRVSGLNNMGYLTGVARIITGNGYFFAITSTGELVGWGNNWHGTFGDGSNYNQYNYPVYVYNAGAVFVDEHGNTSETASEIVHSPTVNGYPQYHAAGAIDYVGDVDVFNFSVPTTGTYHLSTICNCNLEVFAIDDKGTADEEDDETHYATLDETESAGEENIFRITFDLVAENTYYIEVKHEETGLGAYDLYIEAPFNVTVE